MARTSAISTLASFGERGIRELMDIASDGCLGTAVRGGRKLVATFAAAINASFAETLLCCAQVRVAALKGAATMQSELLSQVELADELADTVRECCFDPQPSMRSAGIEALCELHLRAGGQVPALRERRLLTHLFHKLKVL